MDRKLLAWARQVKARAAGNRGKRRDGRPPLWLFTDAARLPDPLAAISSLPRGLCGVVFRHDGAAARAALAQAVAKACRERRLALSVAGDWRLAARVGAGLHLRGGKILGSPPRRLLRATSSAHSAIEVVRARRAGALVFISPVFPTASHPGSRGMGVVRWAIRARAAGRLAAALGGIDGRMARKLPTRCVAAGAIDALAPCPKATPLRVRHSVSELPCRARANGCGNVTGAAIVLREVRPPLPLRSPQLPAIRERFGAVIRQPDCPALCGGIHA
jgi:thiamine-phosphate pyrophosphorylase